MKHFGECELLFYSLKSNQVGEWRREKRLVYYRECTVFSWAILHQHILTFWWKEITLWPWKGKEKTHNHTNKKKEIPFQQSAEER